MVQVEWRWLDGRRAQKACRSYGDAVTFMTGLANSGSAKRIRTVA
jgi:hypothetical protein